MGRPRLFGCTSQITRIGSSQKRDINSLISKSASRIRGPITCPPVSYGHRMGYSTCAIPSHDFLPGIHFAKHRENILQVTVVQEPNGRVIEILFKRHCQETSNAFYRKHATLFEHTCKTVCHIDDATSGTAEQHPDDAFRCLFCHSIVMIDDTEEDQRMKDDTFRYKNHGGGGRRSNGSISQSCLFINEILAVLANSQNEHRLDVTQ